MSKRDIVHIEVPAADRKEAAKFYSDLFGWGSTHMDEMEYTMWEAGNGAGGFPDVGDQFKPGDVVIYISSEDIDADLKEIKAHGGKTMLPKTEIPGMGWFAFFSDPTGNRIGLYEENAG